MCIRDRFDLVIRALNEERHLAPLLESLNEQTVKPASVVLVDSGSTDATVDIAERHGCRVVKIAKDDFTFGRSLNVGIAATTAPIVVMASAHVLPTDAKWLENLVEPFRSHPGCVLSYGKQRGNVESAFSEQQILRKWFPEDSCFPQDNPFCNNANCAIRRAEWEAHTYDEDLAGLEDLAFARIAIARGGSIAYRADAGIIHIHDESLAGIVNRYRRESHAYFQVEGDRLRIGQAATLAVSNIARDLLAASKRRELRRQIVSIVRFRCAQFYGSHVGGRVAYRESHVSSLRRRYYYPHKVENGGRNRRVEV